MLLLDALGQRLPRAVLAVRENGWGFEPAIVANHWTSSSCAAWALNPPSVWIEARTGIVSPKIRTVFSRSTRRRPSEPGD